MVGLDQAVVGFIVPGEPMGEVEGRQGDERRGELVVGDGFVQAGEHRGGRLSGMGLHGLPVQLQQIDRGSMSSSIAGKPAAGGLVLFRFDK